MNDLRAVDRIEHPDVFGVGAFVAELLADDPVLGKVGRDQLAHGGFRRAVRLGDGIEFAPGLLVLDAERGAEEGQDGLAGRGGELFDEGGEIDDRHGWFLSDRSLPRQHQLPGRLQAKAV